MTPTKFASRQHAKQRQIYTKRSHVDEGEKSLKAIRDIARALDEISPSRRDLFDVLSGIKR